MASLPTYYCALQFHHCFSSISPRLCYLRRRELSRRFPASEKVGVFTFRENLRGKDGKVFSSLCFLCKASAEVDRVSVVEEVERPPFDINLAVVLAGFAFEAYTSPPENIGRREVDAAGCKTVYLSESFVREIYDGQVFLKLIEGFDLPAMDPWGTSDPYVVMELDGQIVKSKIKWGTKEPKWNEDFTFNIKQPPKRNLQVAAWDANLIAPHKRMGNTGINLESFCDGNMHELVVQLEGMGGGGKLKLEVKYKTFDQIEVAKEWWRLPFVSEFLRKSGFDSALKTIVGSETVQARQFVQYAFGQLKSFNDAYLTKDWISKSDKNVRNEIEKSNEVTLPSDIPSQIEGSAEGPSNSIQNDGTNVEEFHTVNDEVGNEDSAEVVPQVGETMESDKHFWKSFANIINQSVVQKLDLPTPENLKWDNFDLLNRIGLQSKSIAEAGYIESGLATSEGMDKAPDKRSGSLDVNAIRSSLPDIKKATEDLLKQTDSVLGALMVLTAAISESN